MPEHMPIPNDAPDTPPSEPVAALRDGRIVHRCEACGTLGQFDVEARPREVLFDCAVHGNGPDATGEGPCDDPTPLYAETNAHDVAAVNRHQRREITLLDMGHAISMVARHANYDEIAAVLERVRVQMREFR